MSQTAYQRMSLFVRLRRHGAPINEEALIQMYHNARKEYLASNDKPSYDLRVFSAVENLLDIHETKRVKSLEDKA